jgi:hypothetical protein
MAILAPSLNVHKRYPFENLGMPLWEKPLPPLPRLAAAYTLENPLFGSRMAVNQPVICHIPIHRNITGGIGPFPAPPHFFAGPIWVVLGADRRFPTVEATDSRLVALPYSEL